MGIAYRVRSGVLTGMLTALLATASHAAAQVTPTGALEEDVADAEIDPAINAPTVSGTQDPWEGFNRKMFAVVAFSPI